MTVEELRASANSFAVYSDLFQAALAKHSNNLRKAEKEVAHY